MAPRHLNCPLTMMASLVQRASHSSMLRGNGRKCQLHAILFLPFVLPTLSLFLFHLPVRGENDTPPIFDDAGESIPEESSGGWVHSSGRLIKE